ncbi:MAG: F0F1 ATP synthase subunit B [Anaerolineae bacterium]|nr:F0F1 ATP synthase subunit B [Anaerolineae bacterium]
MEKLGINLNYLIAQIINFGVLLYLLKRFLYGPLLSMLEARRERIRGSLAEADRVREQAAAERERLQQELEAAQRESQEALQKAMQASEHIREEILRQARQEAAEIKARAREEAEHEREQILERAREQIAELVVLATERVVSQSLDERAQRKIIQDFLNELEAAS